MFGKEYEVVPKPYTLPEKPEDYFPCLMVVAGSGTVILLVSMTEIMLFKIRQEIDTCTKGKIGLICTRE